MRASQAPTQSSQASGAKRGRFVSSQRKTTSANSRRTFSTIPRALPRLQTGFPKQLMITHRYVDTFVLATSSSLIGKYVFSANGLFDCNISGTGHQPMYFDQQTGIYNHYVVVRSKIKVYASSAASAGVPTMLCILGNDDPTTTPVSMEGVRENANASLMKMIVPDQGSSVILTASYDANQIFGPSALSQDSLEGTAAANPTEGYFFVVCQQGIPVTGTTINYFVEIEYQALWRELKDIVSS